MPPTNAIPRSRYDRIRKLWFGVDLGLGTEIRWPNYTMFIARPFDWEIDA